jgi:signal transduction histidine kinase
MSNLLANAGDAVGESGTIEVRITMAAPPAQVTWAAADLNRDQAFLCVQVKDSGPGFSATALRHLFEPFFTTKGDGHGLGLSAAQGIIAAHNGALDVRNGPGGEVVLYLPAAANAPVRDVSSPQDRILKM